MQLNWITTDVELLGTSIKSLTVNNEIPDISRDAKRNFGLNINEPTFVKDGNTLYAHMVIDFEVEIRQSEDQECTITLSLEGAFSGAKGIDPNLFKERVIVNGASALIGIARGKIENISATIFNNGKIIIPYVNVIDYYKSMIE